VLAEKLLEDGSYLDCLRCAENYREHESTERVPDSQRLAAGLVPGAPPTLEVHGPNIIGTLDVNLWRTLNDAGRASFASLSNELGAFEDPRDGAFAR
jgi:hypothetical protein